MADVHKMLARIKKAKARARKEGRLDDPDFQDWLEDAYDQLSAESSRSYRWYGHEIELGKGQFGC